MAKKKTNPGKGYKICPECGSTVGARTQECDCGHAFGKKRVRTHGANTIPSDEQLATAYAAQKLINKCGGVEAAVSLLKSVGKLSV